MAVIAAALPYIAAATAVAGTVASIEQGRQARNDQKDARRAQENARAEQQAQQNADAANARRNQMREARIKRAQIVQASENTGTAGSSGEMGATAGMNTALGSNLGLSQGNIERSQRIGDFNQEASNFMADAQTHANRGAAYQQIGNFAGNIFNNLETAQAKADKKQGLK